MKDYQAVGLFVTNDFSDVKTILVKDFVLVILRIVLQNVDEGAVGTEL
jgi:hypothetical protein